MGINRKIIKEQNLAARSGKYISKAQAIERMLKRKEDDKAKALKGKK